MADELVTTPEEISSEPEVVSSTTGTTDSLEALQDLQQVSIRSFGDLAALQRQLLDEQRSVLREINEQKTENQRLTAQLIERNNLLQEKLELISKVEKEQHSRPGVEATQKLKKPFSPLGY